MSRMAGMWGMAQIGATPATAETAEVPALNGAVAPAVYSRALPAEYEAQLAHPSPHRPAPRVHSHQKYVRTAHTGYNPCAIAIARGWPKKRFRNMGNGYSDPYA